jgi:hypothetical protein
MCSTLHSLCCLVLLAAQHQLGLLAEYPAAPNHLLLAAAVLQHHGLLLSLVPRQGLFQTVLLLKRHAIRQQDPPVQ